MRNFALFPSLAYGDSLYSLFREAYKKSVVRTHCALRGRGVPPCITNADLAGARTRQQPRAKDLGRWNGTLFFIQRRRKRHEMYAKRRRDMRIAGLRRRQHECSHIEFSFHLKR